MGIDELELLSRLAGLECPNAASSPSSNSSGACADQVRAFARATSAATLVVAAPMRLAGLVAADGRTFDATRLDDTRIALPRGSGKFVDQLTGEPVGTVTEDGLSRLHASKLFASLPVALLIGPGSLISTR